MESSLTKKFIDQFFNDMLDSLETPTHYIWKGEMIEIDSKRHKEILKELNAK